MIPNGYCGLVIEEDNFWQGFFLSGQNVEAARAYIERIRDAVVTTPSVRVKAPARDLGLPAADAALANAIAAAFATAARQAWKHDKLAFTKDIVLYGATEMIEAIRQLIGRDFFLIRAKASRLVYTEFVKKAPIEVGMITEITAIDVETTDQAKAWIDKSPEVLRCKTRLMGSMPRGTSNARH